MSSWSKKVKIEIRATNIDRKVSRFNILVTYSHSIGEISTGLKKTWKIERLVCTQKPNQKKNNNNNRDSHKRKDLIHEHLLQSLTQISMVLLALSLTRTAGFLHSVYRKKDENPLAFPTFPRILKTRLNTKLFMKWECFFHKRFFHKWEWFYKFWEQ